MTNVNTYRVILITTTENNLAYVCVSMRPEFEKLHFALHSTPNLLERLQVATKSNLRYELLELIENCTPAMRRDREIYWLRFCNERYSLLNRQRNMKNI